MPIKVPVLCGAGFFGGPGGLLESATCQELVDILVKHGQVGIDSARIYAAGASEKMLSQLDLKGTRVDTKVFPEIAGDHAPAKLKEKFQASLDALGTVKIRIFYLHAPDRTIPFEETLGAVDELYRQGHFEEFGLSNYNSWEVSEIVGICKSKGWVLPTVYQGIYNCFDRGIETELVPCLRKFGLRFVAYSPLAGGFLTGKYLNEAKAEPGSHFDPNWHLSTFYTRRYMSSHQALQDVKDVSDKHDLPLGEVATRWLQHHGVLTPTDGIIFGASTPRQFDIALTHSAKGPLPEDVVASLDSAWTKVRGGVPHYAI